MSQYDYSKDSYQIDLSRLSLDTIDLGTFAGFNNLQLLFLENNKITKIEQGMFNGLSSFREL